jgi:hypothetical protein
MKVMTAVKVRLFARSPLYGFASSDMPHRSAGGATDRAAMEAAAAGCRWGQQEVICQAGMVGLYAWPLELVYAALICAT